MLIADEDIVGTTNNYDFIDFLDYDYDEVYRI